MEELGIDPKKGLSGVMPHLADQMESKPSGEDAEAAEPDDQ